VVSMATVRRWTGAETKALRRAMRLSIRDFARQLDVAARTVARWEARSADITLAHETQGLADTVFARVSDEVRERFAEQLAAGEPAMKVAEQDAPVVQPPTDGAVHLPVLVDGRPMFVQIDAANMTTSGLAGFLDGFMGMESAGSPAVAAESDTMSPLDRRTFLKAGVGTAIWSALNPDELRHVIAALEEPRLNLNSSVVEYFHRQLTARMTDDGAKGPTSTLPSVLGLLVTIEQSAREVDANIRRQLLKVAARGAEFVGWLYRDMHDPLRGGFWYDRATEWAQEAGDMSMQGYVLLKKAQMAYDERDAVRVLTFSQAAQNGPWQLPVRVKAEVTQQEARGLAMNGESMRLVEQKLDDARRLLSNAEVDGSPHELGAYYNEGTMTLRTASCYVEAGRPRQAAELFGGVLKDDQLSRRDRGYFMARLASSLALAGEPDEAARLGLEAVDLATATTSQRTKRELGRAVKTLQPWIGRPGPRELREALEK
jgi:hypothetical protein